ncbi:MAG: imidazole glycerol phosphate synthase subunit HisH [Dehalococcoidia bacterium SM23_28_2]|nr:MAG: imidazole glycerol phosphate synthase subunit HisH [Dehalococcoidia bacterium SM23_28_2]
MKLIVVDYGAGNLRSVAIALRRLGLDPLVTSEPRAVHSADALVLPGVGAAADTMSNLAQRRLVEPIGEYIASGRPFLGICMGLQVLFSVSEEGGEHHCLDILPGRVKRLPEGLKVPHMGWNRVCQRCPHPIFDGIGDDAFFYFVHSYYAYPEDSSVVVGDTDYGVTFPAVVAKDNIVATQFHPEKSAEAGLRLYENFLRMAQSRSAG